MVFFVMVTQVFNEPFGEIMFDCLPAVELDRPLSFVDDYRHSRVATLPHKSRAANVKDISQKDLFIKQVCIQGKKVGRGASPFPSR